jgi:tetratricopeptide (TPR) repeat protein
MAARQVKGLAFLAATVRTVPAAVPAAAEPLVAVPAPSVAPSADVTAAVCPAVIAGPQINVGGGSTSRGKSKPNPAKSGRKLPLIAAGVLSAIGGVVGGVIALRSGNDEKVEQASVAATVAPGSTPSALGPADASGTVATTPTPWTEQPKTSLGVLYDTNAPAPPPPISTVAPTALVRTYSTDIAPTTDLPAAALARLQAALVRLDFERGSLSYRSLGIPLGEPGEVARLGGVPDKFESATATRLADGKSAPITGFTSAIIHSRLALLKTDLPTSPATVPIGGRPAAGSTVIVFGFGLRSAVPYVLGKGIVEEDTGRVSPGGYEGARFFRITFDTTKETLRGSDLLLNEQGEIVGFAVMRGMHSNQAACMEISHLSELLSQRRPAPGTLADLYSERAKQAGPTSPTITVTITPGSSQRPTGSPSGVATTAPATSGSADGPRPTPTGGISVASASGAAPGRIVGVGGTLSGGAPSAATTTAANSPESRWLLDMKSMIDRRREMLAKNAEIEERVKPLVAESQALDTQYRDLDAKARPITARLSWLANKISSIQFLRVRAEPSERIAMDVEVQIFQAEQGRLNTQYQQMVAQSNGIRKQYDALQARIKGEDIVVAGLNAEALKLRTAFIKHLAPLDGSAQPQGESAIAYVTGLIEGGSDAEIGHFVRGSLRLQEGDLSAAIADLDAAVNFNPRDSMYRTVRAKAYFRLGREADAKKELAEALKANGKNAWVPYLTALSYCKNGAFTAIEAQLREAMKIDPDFVEAKTLMALVKSTADDDKVRNGDYALKMAQAADAASESPTCVTRLANAAALAETGKFDEAAQAAQAALASAAGGPQAEWCRECLKTIEAKQPVRIDWKSFDVWTRL